ncbi:MAG: hypothetical protein AAGA66_11465 [Bacteroidota bacterium]
MSVPALSFSLLIITTSVFAQVNEMKLADTVKFINQEISGLQSLNYNQESTRLNFDDCNIEYYRTMKNDTNHWEIYSYWLPDLDEHKMKVEFSEGSWILKLTTLSDRKIKFDTTHGSGKVSTFSFFSEEKAPLIEIGQALFYAIRNCKRLDRFQD